MCRFAPSCQPFSGVISSQNAVQRGISRVEPDKPARKPGRPRKYAGGRQNLTVRFTPEAYAALRAAANHNRRSLSEEVEARIEHSFRNNLVQEIERRFAEGTLATMQRIAQIENRIAASKRDEVSTEELNERSRVCSPSWH